MGTYTQRGKLNRPQRGGKVGRLWQDVAHGAGELTALRNQVAVLQRQVQSLSRRRGNVLSPIHPFKVYQLPLHFRQSTDPNGVNYSDNTDWQKFRVRSGAATLLNLDNAAAVAQTSAYINVAGTDGVVNPDIETYLDNPLAQDIVIPVGYAAYYFWVTLSIDPASGIATAQLYYGSDPNSDAQPNIDHWPSFPQPDATHQLIAVADSNTFAQSNTILIRQLARADLLFFTTNAFAICDPVSGKSLGNATILGGKPK